MKRFYSHLIEIDSLTVELESLNLADHEKHELANLVDSNIHNVVMDAILSNLNEEDKRKFAEIVLSDDHDKIWKFLNQKSDNVADDVKKAAHDFKRKLHEDVKEARNKN